MRQRGLTLVETVIGLTVIGIAFYILIAVFVTLSPRTIQVETLNKKVYLAQEKMEEYLARDFTAIASVAAASFTGDFSTYSYQITAANVNSSDLNTATSEATGFKNVKVRVWGGPIDSAAAVEIVSLVTTYEVQ